MKDIIPAVDPALIEQELTADTFVRNTNKAGNTVHIIRANQAANTMREIARLANSRSGSAVAAAATSWISTASILWISLTDN